MTQHIVNGMVEDKDSGLILPEQVVRDKHTETWAYSTIKKIRYAAKEMHDREVELVLVCRKCEKPIALETASGELVCECKRRRVL